MSSGAAKGCERQDKDAQHRARVKKQIPFNRLNKDQMSYVDTQNLISINHLMKEFAIRNPA